MFIEALTAKTIYTGRSAESYIEEAIAQTTGPGEYTPNVYRLKSYMVAMHSVEATPSVDIIREYLAGARGIISEPMQNIWSSNATHEHGGSNGVQLPAGVVPYVKRSRK